MKHIIAMGTIVVIAGAVIMTGLWYQEEQKKQFEYDQIVAISERNKTEPTNGTDIDQTKEDPFGLFGPNEVVYEVTFTTLWSSSRHPDHHDSRAHFSEPVIWVGRDNPVFALGQPATIGMEDMAETGRTSDIKKELEELVAQGRLFDFQIHSRVETPDSQSYQVTVNRENPVVSLVSMIAPSPDWFVAIEGVNLQEDGRWIKELSLQTLVLDTGTEEGTEFSINNQATDPQGLILELTDIPSRSLPTFAEVTFKQIGYEGN